MSLHVAELGLETITFERVYQAEIDDVWALWTTKDGLEEWFAPEGMEVEFEPFELGVGARLDHVMTAVRAEEIAFHAKLGRSPTARISARYVEVVHHKRLRIRFTIDFVPGVEPYPYDMLVELHTEAGRVRMVLTADRHPDAEMNRGAVLGYTSQLQRFDLALAARTSQER